jgi:hypothetical protein
MSSPSRLELWARSYTLQAQSWSKTSIRTEDRYSNLNQPRLSKLDSYKTRGVRAPSVGVYSVRLNRRPPW